MDLEQHDIDHLGDLRQTNLDIRLPLAIEFFRRFDFVTPEAGDIFFQTFCIGNDINQPHYPFERFMDYQKVLEEIFVDDPIKYYQIHKGTPFYFLSWLSFQIQSFEKAVFYMDAAVSEDIRKTIYHHKTECPNETANDDELAKGLLNRWIKNASGQFFTLNIQPFYPAATAIVTNLTTLWQLHFQRFLTETGNSILKDDFIDKFILKLAETASGRSIITALYSFVLEFSEINKLIQLRSKTGGTLEPVVTYLFKGGLIFESLLKSLYPLDNKKKKITTIGGLRENLKFTSKYGISQIKTSASTLNEIVIQIGANFDLQTAFDTTAKIRNTTGHNLAWDDVFNIHGNFELIYSQIINAFFYIYIKDFN